MSVAFNSCDVQTTQALAAMLAKQCASGDCILLYGDLGAGKTTFARGFISTLCEVAEDIVSPTFTLVQTYSGQSGKSVWHFDLYRLKKAEEVEELGLDEALATGIALIEWPQLIEARVPANALKVQLAYGKGDERTISFQGNAAWEKRLKEIAG
jgi:tRNA threonylcarbamoyladenosine biosynthesis protein TsaE